MADTGVEEHATIQAKPPIPKVIATAILKIQKTLKPLPKSKRNEAFGSSYVPLEDVMDKALELLTAHGVGVTQPPCVDEFGHAALETTLFTASGQTYTRITKLALAKVDPQAHGSAITYTRRYALMSMLGMTGEGEDDDGNKASGAQVPVGEDQIARIRSLCLAMKFPPGDIEQQIFNVKTRDHAILTIKNLENMVSMKARDDESKDNATALEDEHKGITITVGTGDIESDDATMDPLSEAGFRKRLRDLKLAGPEYERKVMVAATKAYNIVTIMKDETKIKNLDDFLKYYESGTQRFEAEWYAPQSENIIVDENVA